MDKITACRKAAVVTFAAVLVAGFSVGAMAADKDTEFQKKHPRREQVNHRLNHQHRRINKEVKEGELSPQQAKALHKQDRQIRQEERDMASHNGGHITKQEQKTLNQQESAVSREIGK